MTSAGRFRRWVAKTSSSARQRKDFKRMIILPAGRIERPFYSWGGVQRSGNAETYGMADQSRGGLFWFHRELH